MRVIAVFLVAFAFVLVVACSGGEEDSFIQNPSPVVEENPAENSFDDQISADGVVLTEEGAYHNAIDFSPAPTRAEREPAYFQVATALTASVFNRPTRDLSYELVWEEVRDGNARVSIVGMSEENGEWIERQADFRITRMPSGSWILKDEAKFEKTVHQRGLERQEQKKIEDEIQRQQEIAKWAGLLDTFDQIKVSVSAPEKIPASNPEEGTFGLRFLVTIDNPTSESHTVSYDINWEGESFSPNSGACRPDYRDRRPTKDSVLLSGSEKVGSGETVVVEKEESFLAYCFDVEVHSYEVVLERINNYTRGWVEEKLAELQTSPP